MENINRIRAVLLVIIVTVLLTAIYYIQAKKNNGKKGISVAKVESGIKQFHVIEQTPEKVNWELWAQQANITSNEQVSDLTKPRIKVFLETIDTPIEIHSNKGNLNSITKKITLTDDVAAKTGEFDITTDMIVWKSEGSLLETESPVKMTGKNFYVEGVGLKAYIKEEKVELLSQVSGQILVDKLPEKNGTN